MQYKKLRAPFAHPTIYKITPIQNRIIQPYKPPLTFGRHRLQQSASYSHTSVFESVSIGFWKPFSPQTILLSLIRDEEWEFYFQFEILQMVFYLSIIMSRHVSQHIIHIMF